MMPTAASAESEPVANASLDTSPEPEVEAEIVEEPKLTEAVATKPEPEVPVVPDDYSNMPTPPALTGLEKEDEVQADQPFEQLIADQLPVVPDDYSNMPKPPAPAGLEKEDEVRADQPFEQPIADLLPDTSSDISSPLELGEIASAPDEHSYGNDIRDLEPAAIPEQEETIDRVSSVPDDEITSSASDIFEEETVIAKPDNILDLPDAGSEPSKFDSVRIIDDRYTPTGSRPTDISEQTAKPSEGTSAPLPRSQTSSSIGLVDTDGRRSAKLKPLEEGAVLNSRYEIVRKIGGGGMGAVYLASDNNLGGVLRAVKEMVQAHIEEEQQAKAIEDFRRESTILSQLDHPSIPTIYDYFFDELEGRFYLVMKYISGGDLSARLRAAPEGKIDEKSVTEWGIQIADVLDYLHNQPSTIVYRDLKPSNIMIDGNSGRVMLIDFGIARSINQKEEKGVTAVGTMGYAPPELFSGNVEPRSDIYSLGSTMFHLLTGADPQSNPLLIFDFQKNPRPRQINPQLSDEIERFIMRSVEYNSTSRFESAAEVRGFLTEHLANLNKGLVSYGVNEVPESVSLANQPVFCGFCGQRIVATDLFCAFCGAKQPIAQKGVHSEIYGRTAVTAKLLVEGTAELQSPVFSLEKGEILIGRRDPMSNIFPEVDLSKYDPQTKISRRHARIWREGNTFLVEDLGSSNGTVLMPIVHDSFRLAPRQPQALTNGDKIRVGDTTLHFVLN